MNGDMKYDVESASTLHDEIASGLSRRAWHHKHNNLAEESWFTNLKIAEIGLSGDDSHHSNNVTVRSL